MATLYFFCGKIASGKSSLARKVAADKGALLLSEDVWLDKLYSGEVSSLEDYVKRSGQLKSALEVLLVDLLAAGTSVVLDFPANTPGQRNWMRGLCERAGAAHILYVLDVPDDICRARLRARNMAGDHEFNASDEQFDQFAKYFKLPDAEEGFEIELVTAF